MVEHDTVVQLLTTCVLDSVSLCTCAEVVPTTLEIILLCIWVRTCVLKEENCVNHWTSCEFAFYSELHVLHIIVSFGEWKCAQIRELCLCAANHWNGH